MSTATETRDRPVIMQAHSVRAILNGRKTMTRRVVKPQPFPLKNGSHGIPTYEGDFAWPHNRGFSPGFTVSNKQNGPEGWAEEHGPFRVGDRLWVKEAFSLNHSIHYAHNNGRDMTGMIYRASWPGQLDHYDRPFEGERRWRSPLFMPRWASRITLEITGVRVERLQDITPEDVWAEGLRRGIYRHANKRFNECADGDEAETPDGRVFKPVAAFADTWDEINCERSRGAFSWQANPWVFAITFKLTKDAPR